MPHEKTSVLSQHAYSITCTIKPNLYIRLERMYKADVVKMTKHVQLILSKILDKLCYRYHIQGEMWEKDEMTRLHYHGILYVHEDMIQQISNRMMSIRIRLGIMKLKQLNTLGSLLRATLYYKKNLHRKPYIPYFGKYHRLKEVDISLPLKKEVCKKKKILVLHKKTIIELLSNSTDAREGSGRE